MSMNMVQLDNGNFIVQSHVGQVIMSTTLDTEDKVKQYYGGTSWTKIEGRFLIGASDDYDVGTTGGEATHVLTVAEMPSHFHWDNYYWDGSGSTGVYDWKTCMINTANGGTGNWTQYANDEIVSLTGGSQAHNNIPPYYAVYIWVRTA